MNDMQPQDVYRFRVVLSYDADSGCAIAEVPTLNLADYGKDSREALKNIQDMLSFHLECLVLEGGEIPVEESREEGLCIQVRVPVVAA